jgi:hypothetical protein
MAAFVASFKKKQKHSLSGVRPAKIVSWHMRKCGARVRMAESVCIGKRYFCLVRLYHSSDVWHCYGMLGRRLPHTGQDTIIEFVISWYPEGPLYRWSDLIDSNSVHYTAIIRLVCTGILAKSFILRYIEYIFQTLNTVISDYYFVIYTCVPGCNGSGARLPSFVAEHAI